MPSLLLAEHEYQARDFIDRGLDKDARWLALGPSAMSYLDGLGVEYSIPEDFYSADEFDRFCDKTHQQVESICGRLDDRLLSFYPELKSKGIAPFRFNIFHLMMIFDAVRGRVFQLQQVCRSHSQHTIYVHEGPHFPLNSNHLLFSNSETLWGHVASLPGWNHRIELLPNSAGESSSKAANSAGTARSGIRKHILRSVFLTSVARLWSLRDYRGLGNLMSKKRETFLVVNAPYEWAYVLPRLSQEGHKLLFVSDEYFDQSEPSAGALPQPGFEGDADETLRQTFDVDGIDTYTLLRDRLANIWQTGPWQFNDVGQRFEELKDRHGIAAVLRCSAGSGVDHAINQSARTYALPVFVWQHGAVSYCGRITQFREYADLMTADYAFVYGAEVARGYGHYENRFAARVIPLGAPSLDAIAAASKASCGEDRRAASKRPRILYATTNYMENDWYSGWSPAFSDRLFFRDQSRIAGYLAEAGGAGLAEVIVKLHPSDQYQQPGWTAKLRAARGVRLVKDEQSFESLLGACDAVVLDLPSTTLLQSIAAGLPIFALLKHFRFEAELKAVLGKRVVTAESASELIDKLAEFVKTASYERDVEDNAFSSLQGTHLSDGRSADRAIETLATIMNPAIAAAHGFASTAAKSLPGHATR